MSDKDRQQLKRRQAVVPVIGHLKANHRMARCRLKGAIGDAINTVFAAAGFNLRWLMRAVVRLPFLISIFEHDKQQILGLLSAAFADAKRHQHARPLEFA